MANESNASRNTLCWNCRNACGGCSWSRELLPVTGWNAEARSQDELGISWLIKECPEFIPDAKRSGSLRLTEDEILERYVLCDEDSFFRWNNHCQIYA